MILILKTLKKLIFLLVFAGANIYFEADYQKCNKINI